TDGQDRKLAELHARIAATEAEWPALREAARPAFAAWLANRGGRPGRPTGMVGDFALWRIDGGKVANRADAAKPARAAEGPTRRADGDGLFAELSGENGYTFPGVGHFTRSDPFSLTLDVRPSALAPRAVLVHHSRAPIDAGSRGY